MCYVASQRVFRQYAPDSRRFPRRAPQPRKDRTAASAKSLAMRTRPRGAPGAVRQTRESRRSPWLTRLAAIVARSSTDSKGICQSPPTTKTACCAFPARGYAAAASGPIPSKRNRFFHGLSPARLALSVGMPRMRLTNCGLLPETGSLRQALRDPGLPAPRRSTSEPGRRLVKHRPSVTGREGDHLQPYNESRSSNPPEWAVEIFKEARRAGLICSYVLERKNGTEEGDRLTSAPYVRTSTRSI